MDAIAREASNCSTKFGPPTVAQQPSYPQIFPRSQRCVASPTPSARNVTGSTFSSTMLASARAALPVNERPARTATSCALLSTTSPDFLLTRVLLPLLMLGMPARIVNVSSLGQHPIDFDDVMLTRGYSGSRAYAKASSPSSNLMVDAFGRRR